MVARVEAQWRYRDLRVLRLENEFLRLDILPELGAKIYNLIHKHADRNILWHNPRIALHRAPFGANFDNHWAGGWDEPFPNGAECVYAGETLPYLGELWALEWSWEILEDSPQRVMVHLWCDGPITTARVEKTITLEARSPIVRFDHRITNTGTFPFDFNWGIHPAFSVTPASRIDLPNPHGVVAEAVGGVLGDVGTTFTWPYVPAHNGEMGDLRFPLPREAAVMSFSYLEGLEHGWLAVTDRASESGFGLVFPHDIFRCMWLYLCYGGYRDLNVAIVEPWTGYPSKLSEAVLAGRYRTLAAGETLEAIIYGSVYAGVQSISSIDAGGEVRP
jgi:hypothetical protein